MAKRLLSKDYEGIVLYTFQLPISDFYKYYSNIIEEHYPFNDDFFQELISALNGKINWYKQQHTDDYGDGGRTWDGDKLMNPDEIYIPILHFNIEGNIYTHISKSFFDEQIELVNKLKLFYELKKLIDEAKIIRYRVQQLEKENLQNSNSTPSKNRRLGTFESLFIKEEDSDKVIKIIKDEGYLFSDKWTYPGKNKSIATPFYVLLDYFGIITNDTTPQRTKLRIWCNKFGLKANDSDLKNLLSNPAKGKNPTPSFRREQKEFYKLFKLSFHPIRPLEETE